MTGPRSWRGGRDQEGDQVVNIDRSGHEHSSDQIEVHGLSGNVVFFPANRYTTGCGDNFGLWFSQPCQIALVSQLHRDEPDAEITSTFDAGIAKTQPRASWPTVTVSTPSVALTSLLTSRATRV